MKLRSFSLIAACALTACNAADHPQSPPNNSYVYKITEDGGPYQRDKTVYDSLNQKSLTAGQKYTIIGQTDATRRPHILIADVTRYYGNKKDDVSSGTMIVMQNGTYSFPCEKLIFDLKASEADSDVPDVTCKLRLIGVVPISANADLATTSN